MASPPPLPESIYYSSRQRVSLKRNDRRVDIMLSQVTTTHLRRIFQVNPAEVYLQDEIDDTAYIPNNDGSFNGLRPMQTLIVEGPQVRSQDSDNAGSATSSISNTSSSNTLSSTEPQVTGFHHNPQFRSVVPGLGRKTSTPNGSASCRVKVLKAEMEWHHKNNKVSFNAFAQTYVEVQEASATVDYITEEIRKKWGENYFLVTSDGLELESSAATKGLAFWKAPRRLIYAVTRNSRKRSMNRSKENLESSDDDDFISHPPLKKKCKSNPIDSKVTLVLEEISDMKKLLNDTMSLTKDCKVPLPLMRLMRDSFKCKICHCIPSSPPLIVSKCCKVILGCESCINSWFSGPDALTKSCPCCRHDRGYNETMTLRGLDEFLVQAQQLIRAIDESSSVQNGEEEN